ncbi:zinc finger (CCCH type) motif-containing protein [Besnoitia besnoiti]|uniref:Zinc finger (CCCH type) motif-containing protein n=1 Tax=Besnoitia besnoiti TaxID=94643 RepID=A0A2A9MB64_BESBE|nr:zinc finger (CCCH type) motif-containing protein [Besnoitia besnoiti]PFH33541.1 zinc finger (CCCH type) motif-containing protein [Besnoitia besnoiti]
MQRRGGGGYNQRGRRGGGGRAAWDRYDGGHSFRGPQSGPDGGCMYSAPPPPPPPPASSSRHFYSSSSNPFNRRGGNAHSSNASWSRRTVFASDDTDGGYSVHTPQHFGARRGGHFAGSRAPVHEGEYGRFKNGSDYGGCGRGAPRGGRGRGGRGGRYRYDDGRKFDSQTLKTISLNEKAPLWRDNRAWDTGVVGALFLFRSPDTSDGAMLDAPNAPHAPLSYCKNFAFSGQCKFGARCRYPHKLQCVGWALEAHGGHAVTCCALNTATPTGLPEVYTGGKDRFLRRWGVVVAEEGNPTVEGARQAFEPEEAPLWLEFECLQELQLQSEPRAMLFTEGVLFLGLDDGLVLALMPSGEMKELRRHTSAVHALVVIDAVLVSAEWEGRVCLWKFENNEFVLAKELDLPGKITCLKDLSVPNISPQAAADGATNGQPPAGEPAERRFLWVGGTNVTILDLLTMNAVATLDVSDAAASRAAERRGLALALSLIAYEKCMLVGFSSGVVKAYSATGQEQFRYDSPYLSAMEGVVSPDGPLLVFGGADSAFHVLKLPQFEETGMLAAHEEGDVKVIRFLSPEFFVTCGEDGVLCMWRWQRSSAPANG